MKRATLARMIDHTLLKPEATPAEIERLCAEAAEHGFATVCVNPLYVALAANLLHGTPVAVCAVAGFPLGATPTPVKRFEALQVLDDGAVEVDMVIPIGRLKAGQHDVVRDDIYALAQLCHEQGALLKVILENALLTDDEKVSACRLAVEAGADFVKTSTGFARSGATVADVALMRQTVGPEIGVKAAGGIRTYADALAMIEAGANRLGASASLKILEEAEE